ncbi:MAG: helix-turn-helix transcriptional regulator [Rhodobacter sp.]|nr:helix-turn-helix transcriptional regulator [Rhodobacter sp.]
MLTTSHRIKLLCEKSGLTLKAACAACGVNYGTLNAQMNRGREIPFSTADAFAQFFNVSLEYFSERRAGYAVTPASLDQSASAKASIATRQLRESDLRAIEEGFLIDTDKVLNWLDRESYILRNFGLIRGRFDLFYPARDGDEMVHPAQLGQESLATIFFNLQGAADYLRKVGGFSPATVGELVSTHISVQKASTYRLDDVDIEVTIDGSKVAGRYRRIMAPISDEAGNKFTFVYAQLIRAFQPKLDVRSRHG